MGIKNLGTFLRKKTPNIIREIPLTSFKYESIALDASVFLYKFVCLDNGLRGNWIDMFLSLFTHLKRYKINPIIVFDGKPPSEKLDTKEKRQTQKNKIKSQIDLVSNTIEEIQEYDTYTEIQDMTFHNSSWKSLFKEDVEIWTKTIALSKLQQLLFKLKSQCIQITKKHTDTLKQVISNLGLVWIQAPDEAERCCAWLAIRGYVKAVATSDTDVLVYGCPIFIQTLSYNCDTVRVVCYDDILQELNIDSQQFTDFCIMCGTDYNTNIPKVGCMKSYDLIVKYKTIDNIPHNIADISILRHNVSRRLFKIDDLDEYFKNQILLKKPEINTYKLNMILNTVNSSYAIDQYFHIQLDNTPHFEIN